MGSQNGIKIIMELVQTLLTWLFCCFRPAIKWFLRQTTRLCELQRICYGEAPGAHRTCAVELSLQQSRSKRILEAMDVMYSEASKQSFASGKIFQKHPNTYLKTDSKRKCQ